jgi:hypothetical protein
MERSTRRLDLPAFPRSRSRPRHPGQLALSRLRRMGRLQLLVLPPLPSMLVAPPCSSSSTSEPRAGRRDGGGRRCKVTGRTKEVSALTAPLQAMTL